MGTPERGFGFYDATVGGGWQVPGEPYADKEGTEAEFRWWRPRMLGGGFPCVSVSMTSSRKLAMGLATIGRFSIKILLPFMTKRS